MEEKPEWLNLYRSGKLELAYAVAVYLEESGAPKDLVRAYNSALTRYDLGEFDDLAEPLGVRLSKREKNDLIKQNDINFLKNLVDHLAENGFPKNNLDTYKEGTAFHKAGEILGISPHTVFSKYYKE